MNHSCRHCQNTDTLLFADLGFAPPSNAYLTAAQLNQPEITFPLKIRVCPRCWLVQTEDYTGAADLFQEDYAYFSSTSTSWLEHAKKYSHAIINKLSLNQKSFVIEIAANDGYLLKNFVTAHIPCLGIEPTDSTADAAEKIGVPIVREFFGVKLAETLQKADLIIANNVFAHVPDINDFSAGLKKALKTNGVITIEFPHLLNLIKLKQFDTFYHEHFSYLSLSSAARILSAQGLKVFDVEKIPTHGGSLRLYVCHAEDTREEQSAVNTILVEEKSLENTATFLVFQKEMENIKNDFLLFLLSAKKEGKSVMAYGAAAKGNTLFNFAGIKTDLIACICDAAPAKQGKFLPGSHIPIFSPSTLRENPPDYLLIMPWNIKAEIIAQNADLRKSGTRFVSFIPTLQYD